MAPIEDHPLRYKLANELHARPFPTMATPCTVVYIAFKQPTDAAGRDRAADLAHLTTLLDKYGAPHPQPGATHFSGQIGRYRMKWEQHTEFVTYTAFSDGLSDRAFDPADFEVFPEEWLDAAPGQRITSAHIRLDARPADTQIEAHLAEWFVPESLAVSTVLDDNAVVAGDFRIDPAGHLRFAVFANADTGSRRLGRIVQRLCEVETYKSMSMLGFSRVRSLSPRIGELDTRLTELMGDMTSGEIPAEETLPKLLAISAELEATSAKSSFRFGATGAYEAIVMQRIAALREGRFKGRQTFAEFMVRRYEPAMRTVKSTEMRLQALADRAIRAGDLLRTRVDVERSAQNQKLLESMDRRADMQLRLQHTVEGLSVVAISYYAVSLAGYLLYPLSDATGLSEGALVAIVTVPVVLLVWGLIRRIRGKIK
ncbi:DUF3422 domain-containing protein [Aestuariivita sp.]|jgi:uncharacterized membrane-anchored protein|uniref:DUF3422 family protein n=1 Tax=Aestuariivita sp. TaxID=1872407 RepID=UPI00216FC192|nr:DUF3422 domain-containing protein [Aestuariivita sp.]MCE8008870.1 DUF3422 domain-containing protein [Aestuariivita sp.]